MKTMMVEPSAWPERTLCWHYPNYRLRAYGDLEGDAAPGGQKPSSAIHSGQWKLIESLEDGSVQLYNLATDVSERHDLSAEHPEVVARLRATLAAWRKETHAPMMSEKKISSDGAGRSPTATKPQSEKRAKTK